MSAAVSDVDHPSKFLRFFKVGDTVRLIYPSGRKARTDSTVAALKRRWED